MKRDWLVQAQAAQSRLSGVVDVTPLQKERHFSQALGLDVWLKREDLHAVRSYKIRGAFNKMAKLKAQGQLGQAVVCASAGNHAQGVAQSCQLLGVSAHIFMPVTTPQQKVIQVRAVGGEAVEIHLVGDHFDQARDAAVAMAASQRWPFIPPFDDEDIIAGQSTIALEMMEQMEQPPDWVFVPIGGGGVAAGMAALIKSQWSETRVIGVEPEGAASMAWAQKHGQPKPLSSIDPFVDGAAVQQVGQLTFALCQKYVDGLISVPNGLVCQTLLSLYNRSGIVAEPAGALALAGVQQSKCVTPGDRVVALISGSNNDVSRMGEIRERAHLYSGQLHYFLVQFPQRSGALRQFVCDVLGPEDDITYFQYQKKHHRELGPVVVGIEQGVGDVAGLMARMQTAAMPYRYLNESPDLYSLLV